MLPCSSMLVLPVFCFVCLLFFLLCFSSRFSLVFVSAILLDKVLDFNRPIPPSNQTLLHIVTYHQRPFVVRWLLDHGADPNTPNAKGNTPMHFAVSQASFLFCACLPSLIFLSSFIFSSVFSGICTFIFISLFSFLHLSFSLCLFISASRLDSRRARKSFLFSVPIAVC